MPPCSAGRLLRIHISESDRCQGKCLYEAIVEKCRAMGMAGATVFRGLEGFGETASIRRPIVIVVVDTAEQIARLMPEVEELVPTGVLAVSDVEVVRVQKT